MSPPSLGENCSRWGGNEAPSTPQGTAGEVKTTRTHPGLQETALASSRGRTLPLCLQSHLPATPVPKTAVQGSPALPGWVWSMGGTCWRVKRWGCPPSPSLAASPAWGQTSCGGSLPPRGDLGEWGAVSCWVRGRPRPWAALSRALDVTSAPRALVSANRGGERQRSLHVGARLACGDTLR